MKIGLVLSGGGTRGIAHVGVIKALEENGISAQWVAGTSAGSIVGAMYAAGRTTEEMMQFVRETKFSKLFRIGLPISGLSDLGFLKKNLSKYIPEDSFESLSKKLYIAISNLNTGTLEIRNSGPLFEVVQASSSVPLVFKPVEIDGQIYTDGGLFENLPAACIRPFCDVLIGVNVMPHATVTNRQLNGMVGIATRCFDLNVWNNTRPSALLCDILITPERLRHFNVFDTKHSDTLYEIGYRAAMDQMESIINFQSSITN